MKPADELANLIFKRTGLKPKELICPREKSDMTPCVARDGDCASTNGGRCVGCGADVMELLYNERQREATP